MHIDSPLLRITYDVEDYFRRLGGSGRHYGYEDWHVFALVALLSRDFFPKKELTGEDQLQSFVFRSGLHKIFDDEYRVASVKKSLILVSDLEIEIQLFLNDVEDHLELALCKPNPRGELTEQEKRNYVECIKGWSVFKWLFENAYSLPSKIRLSED